MDQNSFYTSIISLFSLVALLVTILTAKYSDKISNGIFLDRDFLKPQAFHEKPVARAGGISIFFILLIFFILHFLLFNKFLVDYFTISFLFFTLGFLDDIKIKIKPNTRLVIMLLILIFCINLFSIEINKSGLEFLNIWLSNKIFQTCFVLLCFLFIINGANLVDGFNGLLAIHFLIINSILLSLNLTYDYQGINLIIIVQIISVFCFLLFNFPKAKIFLGDSGSYLLGSITAINTIKTYELIPDVSPFFFAIILFYLFYEVFFSFIRKALKKKSPLKPDKFHFHMLLYDKLKKLKIVNDPNYITSILINLSYLLLLVPAIIFQNDGVFLRYWFFALIIFYTFSYILLLKRKDNHESV